MKHSGRVTAGAAALGMMILILDSKTALQGASDGLSLCIRTVIPSLFPFFVLSGILTSTLTGRQFPFLRPLCRLTGIPEGSESILITGLLGGYPVGAGCIAAAVKRGQLSRAEGQRMLGFCNNAGPSFLFGIAASLFPSRWMGWTLWGIHILSALLVGALIPRTVSTSTMIAPSAPASLPAALRSSLGAIASVCGWVILFRVLLAFMDRWIFWALPDGLVVAITGVLELTNGCCALASVENIGLRFLLCSGMLAFGGLCVAMQTVSAAEGVSMKYYFPGKLLQTLFSCALSCLVVWFLPGSNGSPTYTRLLLIPAVILIVFLLFRPKKKKSCSIPAELGV